MPHLNENERRQIVEEFAWAKGQAQGKDKATIKKVARRLHRAPSTISRELRRNSLTTLAARPASCRTAARCGESPAATATSATTRTSAESHAATAGNATPSARTSARGECRRLKQAPYVCNWCVDYSKCPLKKRMHFSSGAHENYRQTLRKAHSGTHLSWETPCTMDRLLREHLSDGQSIHHIMAHSTNLIPVGGKTVYRLIANGMTPFVRRMDLPEAAGRKRKSSLPEKGRRHADLRRGEGRSCQDFLRHMEGHSTASVVGMDSVIGRV